MKKIILSILGLCTVALATGQSIERSVIGSSGESVVKTSAELDYSVGEMVTLTSSSLNVDHLTQGFIQPAVDESNISVDPIASVTMDVKVFPNPVKGMLNIQMKSSVDKAVQYQIYDMQGRVVLNGSINENSHKVGVSHLASATYILALSIPEEGFTQSIRFTKIL